MSPPAQKKELDSTNMRVNFKVQDIAPDINVKR